MCYHNFQVDVANYEEIVELKEKIKADLGEVDILVNNAGLLPRVSLLQGNPEDILRIIKVNLIGYFWVSVTYSKIVLEMTLIFHLTDDSSIFAGYDSPTAWSYRFTCINYGT